MFPCVKLLIYGINYLQAGLIPVPVDVCFDTLVPTAAMLNACVTSKTVAIMIAQIFGRQSPLQELAEVYIEDFINYINQWCINILSSLYNTCYISRLPLE